jgi:hypothetical protein
MRLGLSSVFALPLLLLVISLPSAALAADDADENSGSEDEFPDEIDDSFFRDDEEEEEKIERFDEADTKEEAEPDGDEDWTDSGEEPVDGDFFQEDDTEETEVEIGGPGQDSAKIYRSFLNQMEDLGPDEEIISWEQYLQKYPNSLFQAKIDTRIEAISEEQFSERVSLSREGLVDAGQREVDLALPLLLESIDPRSKIRAGFEWGYPAYINLLFDYEKQLKREWSVHGGIRNRYTGWSLETGTRYAFVKSARTQTLVTGILDLHLNTNPVFLGVRPQIGVGKRFGSSLDAQAVFGPDFELGDPLGIRWLGGANLTYHTADIVSFFAEFSAQMKHIGWEEAANGPFRFNVVTFGIKIAPKEQTISSVGASVPASYSYWGYHYGSIMGETTYFLD